MRDEEKYTFQSLDKIIETPKLSFFSYSFVPVPQNSAARSKKNLYLNEAKPVPYQQLKIKADQNDSILLFS